MSGTHSIHHIVLTGARRRMRLTLLAISSAMVATTSLRAQTALTAKVSVACAPMQASHGPAFVWGMKRVRRARVFGTVRRMTVYES